MMETTTCVACGKPARMWTGHLKHFERMIGAGWCSEECRLSRSPVKAGYFGPWDQSMAIRHKGKLATRTGCSCGRPCPVWRLDNPRSANTA